MVRQSHGYASSTFPLLSDGLLVHVSALLEHCPGRSLVQGVVRLAHHMTVIPCLIAVSGPGIVVRDGVLVAGLATQTMELQQSHRQQIDVAVLFSGATWQVGRSCRQAPSSALDRLTLVRGSRRRKQHELRQAQAISIVM